MGQLVMTFFIAYQAGGCQCQLSSLCPQFFYLCSFEYSRLCSNFRPTSVGIPRCSHGTKSLGVSPISSNFQTRPHSGHRTLFCAGSGVTPGESIRSPIKLCLHLGQCARSISPRSTRHITTSRTIKELIAEKATVAIVMIPYVAIGTSGINHASVVAQDRVSTITNKVGNAISDTKNMIVGKRYTIAGARANPRPSSDRHSVSVSASNSGNARHIRQITILMHTTYRL